MQLFKNQNYKRNTQKGKVVIPMLETEISFSQTYYIKKGTSDKCDEGKKEKMHSSIFKNFSIFTFLFCFDFAQSIYERKQKLL